jgi:two-component system, NarL family, response regulator
MRAESATCNVRVLLADDHPVVRQGLRAIVERDPHLSVCAEAADGAEAVELWREHMPDVALIDLSMPRMGGVSVVEAVRQLEPNACLVIVTSFDGDEDVFRALRAGAAGYLLKDAPGEELVTAIWSAHAGTRVLPGRVGAKLAQRAALPTLTQRECELLGLLANGHANKELAIANGVTTNTIKTQLRSIFDKLGASNRLEAVRIATERGLLPRH